MTTIEMARERETRPAEWVKAVLAVTNLDEDQIAVRVHKRSSTIYRWQKLGIEYLDWIGLLTVVGLIDVDEDRLRGALLEAGLKDDQVKLFLEDRAHARPLAPR
jgi:hypothetical protein